MIKWLKYIDSGIVAHELEQVKPNLASFPLIVDSMRISLLSKQRVSETLSLEAQYIVGMRLPPIFEVDSPAEEAMVAWLSHGVYFSCPVGVVMPWCLDVFQLRVWKSLCLLCSERVCVCACVLCVRACVRVCACVCTYSCTVYSEVRKGISFTKTEKPQCTKFLVFDSSHFWRSNWRD